MEPHPLIQRLRERIPDFPCEPGCHECCGPVFFSRWEWDQLPVHREPTGLECPYDTGSGCSIHPHRPIICRMFGAVENPTWHCPRNRGPQERIPWEEAWAMLQEYHAMMEGEERDPPPPAP